MADVETAPKYRQEQQSGQDKRKIAREGYPHLGGNREKINLTLIQKFRTGADVLQQKGVRIFTDPIGREQMQTQVYRKSDGQGKILFFVNEIKQQGKNCVLFKKGEGKQHAGNSRIFFQSAD